MTVLLKEKPQDDFEKEISEEPKEDVDAGHLKRKPGQLKLFPIILVIVVLLLAGCIAVFFLAPNLLPDSLSFLKPAKEKPISDQGVAGLSFQDVTGFFIQSDTAGQLFVVKGMVTNNYPGSRRFINIKGSLLDRSSLPFGSVIDMRILRWSGKRLSGQADAGISRPKRL